MCLASTSTSSSRTRFRAAILAFGLCAAALAVADGRGMTLRTAGSSIVEVDPRAVASAALVVENGTTRSVDYRLDAALPEGWRPVTPALELKLDSGSSAVRIVSFFIPANALAGTYPVAFRLIDAATGSAAAECAFQVIVRPVMTADFRVLEKPRFVVAGDSYRIDCSLANAGNREILVRLLASKGGEFEVSYEGLTGVDETVLKVGEVRPVSIVVKTKDDLKRFTTQLVNVNAILRNPDDDIARILGAISCIVEIVPKSVDARFIVNTLPVYFETTATSTYSGDWSGSLSETISAKGTLDDRGEHEVDLYLRKRLGTDTDPLWFDPQDRYTLKYHNPLFDLTLGDDQFGLSPLLGREGLARGVRASAEVGRFGATALYYRDVWMDGGEQGAGGGLSYAVPSETERSDFYRASANFLTPLDGGASIGLSQEYRPMKNVLALADVAVTRSASGAFSPGIYSAITGNPGAFAWNARFMRVWPGFGGSYADSMTAQANLGLALLDGALHLVGGGYYAERNLELDESLASADRTTRIMLGANGKLPRIDTELGLTWENAHRVDRLEDPNYDAWDNIFKLTARREFAPFAASLSTQWDFGADSVTDTNKTIQESTLGLEWAVSDAWNTIASGRFYSAAYAGGGTQSVAGLILGASYAKSGVNVGLGLRNSHSFGVFGWERGDLGFSANYIVRFRNAHVFSATSDISFGFDEAGASGIASLTLSYRLPLELPVSRKGDTAIVRGRVYDVADGRPIAGVLVRLNGLVDISDAKGAFTFYLPRTSSTYLYIDRGTVSADLVPVRELPMEVDTKKNSDQTIDIPLVVSCELRGTVGLYNLARTGSYGEGSGDESENRVRERGLPGLIVEMAGEGRVKRRVTGADGEFAFPDLVPGTYTIKIVGGQIPSYHTVTPASMTVELASGDSREVEIKVTQDRRAIKPVEAATADLVLEMPGTPSEATVVQESPKPAPKGPEPRPEEKSGGEVIPVTPSDHNAAAPEGPSAEATPRETPAESPLAVDERPVAGDPARKSRDTSPAGFGPMPEAAVRPALLGPGFEPDPPAPESERKRPAARAETPAETPGKAPRESVKDGFDQAVPRLGSWERESDLVRQTDSGQYFAKIMVPVVQTMDPMRFAFKARSTGKGWVGVGIHVYVSKSRTFEGYGNGESFLIWLTYDPVHYRKDKTRIQIYRSRTDIDMEMIAEAPVTADIFQFNMLEIDIDPGKGDISVALNGKSVVKATGITGFAPSSNIFFRSIDSAEFSSFKAEKLLPPDPLSPKGKDTKD